MEVLQNSLDDGILGSYHSPLKRPLWGGGVQRDCIVVRLCAVLVCMVHTEKSGDNPRWGASGASHLLFETGCPIGLALHQLGQAKWSVGSRGLQCLFVHSLM